MLIGLLFDAYLTQETILSNAKPHRDELDVIPFVIAGDGNPLMRQA